MVSRTAEKIRQQIAGFSGNLSRGLKKPAQRFVGEMIYGIQARKSVHLTEIGRSLGEWRFASKRAPVRGVSSRVK
jgi:hypothetical protein